MSEFVDNCKLESIPAIIVDVVLTLLSTGTIISHRNNFTLMILL